MKMKKAELIFVPSPGLSHLVSTVEIAKLLLDRDDRLRITLLIMKLPNDASVASYTQKIITSSSSDDLKKSPSSSSLRLLNLPSVDHDQDQAPLSQGIPHDFIEKQRDHVREAVYNLVKESSVDHDSQVAGLVLDMFCTKFIEIGREFGLKSYVFFTSSASGLGLAQYLVDMRSEYQRDQGSGLAELGNSDVEFSTPYFRNPVPAKVLPAEAIRGGTVDFLHYFERIRETDGVMANTFHELESYAIDALNSHGSKTPRVYPVGPILSQSSESFDDDDEVKKWLDDQPENSVVFLCFGTMGSFEGGQVREIALALENSGCRFLWSLRKPATKGGKFVTEYEDLEQVLPEGFLERTEGVGRVVGWAAQKAVLAHAAVGGFVSHCGWNSTMESVWFGVPIATLPLYAEQQMNAFQLVRELGMAEMIRLDYKMKFGGDGPPEIVGWEEIAAAIKRLMAAEGEGGSGVRQKVKEMQSKARAALVEGGSSYCGQNLFIQEVIRNMH